MATCIGDLIEEETHPARCVIRTAGDSSWCETCGHKFDTNALPNNEPPDCRLKVDPFRGGLMT